MVLLKDAANESTRMLRAVAKAAADVVAMSESPSRERSSPRLHGGSVLVSIRGWLGEAATPTCFQGEVPIRANEMTIHRNKNLLQLCVDFRYTAKRIDGAYRPLAVSGQAVLKLY
jgi:hypothetical protein